MPNQQEFTELLQPNLLPLNRFVFGMVGNHFEAEDIVQETVVKQIDAALAIRHPIIEMVNILQDVECVITTPFGRPVVPLV